MALMERLYPICRSITGNGVRETLQYIGEEIPLGVHEVPTGTQVFDWEVPREWNIRDAWIATPDGRRIAEFREHNLHVLNYSTPIHEKMDLEALRPDHVTDKIAVFILPREPWSKRVSGVFGNRLANEYPDRAHAVLSRNDSGAYTVSVRAPLNNRAGAGEFCSSFPGGGGRAAAGGINDLPVAQYGEFLRRFETAFG